MKVIISNDNKTLTGAFCVNNDNDKCLSLYINTLRRNVYPDSITTSWHERDPFITYQFYKDYGFADTQIDSVKFIPENDIEKAKLKNLSFTLHNKDQLWYIFIPDNLY